MKKHITTIIIGLTAIILLTQTNLFNDLLFFFLVGAIPGTTKSVPSSVMLSAIIFASWLVVFRFPAVRALTARLLTHLHAAVLELKGQLAKHRLGDA